MATASASGTASVAATMKAINKACKSKGGSYAQYSCKTVSWDDASRGTVGGGLSCWGSNITDTYLKSKSGASLFTVRADNWNEKLGRVKASEVAAVVGNHTRGGALRPVTLRSLLRNLGTYGSHSGLSAGADLSSAALDDECSIRFQTTFLPVDDSQRAKLEFATEAYNYNTTSDADPKNLVLLCTSQGLAVQQDGRGTKRIFHHAVDERGVTQKHWLEAERSSHKVGGAQNETAAERQDALARGKATSSVIGIKAMGTRFNVLMTVQVPLKQKPRARFRDCGSWGGGGGGGGMYSLGGGGFGGGMLESMTLSMSNCAAAPAMPCSAGAFGSAAPRSRGRGGARRKKKAAPRVGRANAARVSRGSCAGKYEGLKVKAPKRHPAEHVTVTVVIYNTVAGGVPSKADVVAAVDDMEALYAACGASGRLADATFDFMKGELTVNDLSKIQHKVATQPPPPAQDVQQFDVFPTDDEGGNTTASGAQPPMLGTMSADPNAFAA